MWQACTGQLLRVFLTASTALCARFHLVNQNLVMTGTESGLVQVFNCSTGKAPLRKLDHQAMLPCSLHVQCMVSCDYVLRFFVTMYDGLAGKDQSIDVDGQRQPTFPVPLSNLMSTAGLQAS